MQTSCCRQCRLSIVVLHEAHIAPFLENIKKSFGTPLALVHDMGKGILAAVANVFPDVPDFICHFHFLRDIGKDFLGAEYDIIRRRLSRQGIGAKLRYRAKQLKKNMDLHPELVPLLETAIRDAALPADACQCFPVVNAYTLIQWALQGKSEGRGYGFPFDHPHLALAKRIRQVNTDIEHIKDIYLSGDWKDNDPYFKLHVDLQKIMQDKTLWKAVEAIEEKNAIFEKLREAMRIAPKNGSHGLNDEGQKGNIRTIKGRVKKFRAWLTGRKDYPENSAAKKMIGQIDKYWEQLFADPITVQTPSGVVQIQPQRTNNILEQFFRKIKREDRRRTGNASSGRMLRTILAETPLVRNLKNPAYMTILLHGKESLADVFAEIEISAFREAFRKARNAPEKIPEKLKSLIALPDLSERLVSIVKMTAA